MQFNPRVAERPANIVRMALQALGELAMGNDGHSGITCHSDNGSNIFSPNRIINTKQRQFSGCAIRTNIADEQPRSYQASADDYAD